PLARGHPVGDGDDPRLPPLGAHPVASGPAATGARHRKIAMPSVPAAWGRRSAPVPHGIHGSAGTSRVFHPAWLSVNRSATAEVSAAVNVQTEYTRVPPGRTSGAAASSRA